ncbi:hypothetical protein NMR94_000739 [Vibrio cholerae]|nr:hypothetical protein [Vibrio cholerae]
MVGRFTKVPTNHNAERFSRDELSALDITVSEIFSAAVIGVQTIKLLLIAAAMVIFLILNFSF